MAEQTAELVVQVLCPMHRDALTPMPRLPSCGTTATRAPRKLVVLAGSRRALAVAVRDRDAGRRHNALAHRLQ